MHVDLHPSPETPRLQVPAGFGLVHRQLAPVPAANILSLAYPTATMTQLSDYAGPTPGKGEDNGESIEERCFSAALICLEGHFTQSPPMGPQTAARVNSMISKTLEKTHTLRTAR